jgi:plastocyanin
MEAIARSKPRARRAILASVAALTALVLLVTPGAVSRAQSPVSIDIKDSKFIPPALTVPAGTTVRWTNQDEETHTVTSTTNLFASAGLDLGEAYTYTFAAPGVYVYTCDLHPFMQGTIVVK